MPELIKRDGVTGKLKSESQLEIERESPGRKLSGLFSLLTKFTVELLIDIVV